MKIKNNARLLNLLLKKSIKAIDDTKYYVVYVDYSTGLEIPLFGGYDKLSNEVDATFEVYKFQNKYDVILEWEYKLGVRINTDKLIDLVTQRNQHNLVDNTQPQPQPQQNNRYSDLFNDIDKQIRSIDTKEYPKYFQIKTHKPSNGVEIKNDDFAFVVNALFKKLNLIDMEKIRREVNPEKQSELLPSLQLILSYILHAWEYNVANIKEFKKNKEFIKTVYDHAKKTNQQYDLEHVCGIMNLNINFPKEIGFIKRVLFGNKPQQKLEEGCGCGCRADTKSDWVSANPSFFNRKDSVSCVCSLLKILPVVIETNVNNKSLLMQKLLDKYPNEDDKYREFAMDILQGLIDKKQYWIEIFYKLMRVVIEGENKKTNESQAKAKAPEYSELNHFIRVLNSL